MNKVTIFFVALSLKIAFISNSYTDNPSKCKPLPNSEFCSARGDPHFTTFDKFRYDFMGLCSYDLVYSCGDLDKSNLSKFLVRISTERRTGWKTPTSVRSMTLILEEKQFTISKRKFEVDGVLVSPPFVHNSNNNNTSVTTTYACGFMRIETSFGLVIKFDGNMGAYVELSKRYMGHVCGLCGNFDSDPDNDLIIKNENLTVDINKFGNSYQSLTKEAESCKPVVESPNLVCGNSRQKSRIQLRCKSLLENAAFKACHSFVKPEPFYEDCVYDMCSQPSNINMLCNIFQDYAHACKQKANLDLAWRTAGTLCTARCGKNEIYKEKASMCENNCLDPSASAKCTEGTIDMCACRTGYIRSGTECIPSSRCGCLTSFGKYFFYGQSWLTKDCKEKSTCYGALGAITRRMRGCPRDVECETKDNGVETACVRKALGGVNLYNCQPMMNAGICQATGDPHYKTFDRLAFDFQGLCTYDLAYPCGSYADSKLPYFEIQVSNEKRPGWEKASVTKSVSLRLKTKVFTIDHQDILVDGDLITAPFQYKYSEEDGGYLVSITIACKFIRIDVSFGLVIRYDGKMAVYVELSNRFQGKMCGLCGNFDGNPSNDLVMRNGKSTLNPNEFGSSFQSAILQLNPGCKPIINETASDCGTPEKKLAIQSRCGLLKKNPAFTACHSIVDPNVFYDECVFDQCIDPDDPRMTCTVFKNYADECEKLSDLEVEWMKISNCEPDCGPNEEYQEGIPVCENSCADKSARDFCTQGLTSVCTCKPGFLRSGLECIPEMKCGCTDNFGVYRQVGESWMTNGCLIKIMCLGEDRMKPMITEGCNDTETCEKYDASSYRCVPEKPKCRENEIASTNGNICDQTCGNYNLKICQQAPVPECPCAPGFRRKNGKCVLESECDCKDNLNNYYKVGVNWISNDCKWKFTCTTNLTISKQATTGCPLGECKLSDTKDSFTCEPQPGCKDDGRFYTIDSTWIATSCKSTRKCVDDNEINDQPIEGCLKGKCVLSPLRDTFTCETDCKDDNDIVHKLGDVWLSLDCKSRFTCKDDQIITTEELPGCGDQECTIEADGKSYVCPKPEIKECTDKEGNVYPIEDSWISEDCKFNNTCQKDGQITSETIDQCKEGVCKVSSDSKSFQCVAKPIKPSCRPQSTDLTCSIVGNQYRALDDFRFDFGSFCEHELAFSCGEYQETGLEQFSVRSSNEPVSPFNKVVVLSVGSHEFQLSSKGFKVDDVSVNVPFIYNLEDGNKQVVLSFTCRQLTISTNFGLTLRHNGKLRVTVEVSKKLSQFVCGLCAAFEDSSECQCKRKSRDGSITSSVETFASSFRVKSTASSENCQDTVDSLAQCSSAALLSQAKKQCAPIREDASLQNCHAHVCPDCYFVNCVLDQCADVDNQERGCALVDQYATDCSKKTELDVAWQTCESKCGANMVFNQTAVACENSCTDLAAEETCTDESSQPGCVCQKGFVRSGLSCVPPQQCGCTDMNGNYHELEDFWYNSECTVKYVCSKPMKIDKSKVSSCE